MKVTQQNGFIIVDVKVIPKSSKNTLDIIGDLIKIKLKSPPVDGKANKELINFLSKFLKVKKHDIEILRGETSKNKSIRIANITKIDFIKLVGGN